MKHFFKRPAVRKLLAWLLARIFTVLLSTIRWEIDEGPGLAALVAGPPLVVALWHEAIPLAPYLWLLARRRGLARPVAVLASRNADGQLIGQMMRQLGTELVSGSSSQGGREALEALTGAIGAGRHVGLTPDGPRGPRRVAHMGMVRLAARTGALVLPVGMASRPAITLRSWDSMRIPLPFGRGVLRFGAPLPAPEEAAEAALVELSAALSAVQDEALARCS
jgi:lysophospholipid acyltransferase (LPLAT)-like uncharacterized protein